MCGKTPAKPCPKFIPANVYRNFLPVRLFRLRLILNCSYVPTVPSYFGCCKLFPRSFPGVPPYQTTPSRGSFRECIATGNLEGTVGTSQKTLRRSERTPRLHLRHFWRRISKCPNQFSKPFGVPWSLLASLNRSCPGARAFRCAPCRDGSKAPRRRRWMILQRSLAPWA